MFALGPAGNGYLSSPSRVRRNRPRCEVINNIIITINNKKVRTTEMQYFKLAISCLEELLKFSTVVSNSELLE